jgi:hypothetical protein
MRTRVRFIFTLWLAIASAIFAGLAYYRLPLAIGFYAIFAIWLLNSIAFIAIWRTQPTFRRLAHWFTAGLWPRNP